MKNRIKKIVGTTLMAAVVLASVAPAVSHALPTSYSGKRTYSASKGYRSYTTTNGYEAGGKVKNTVTAYLSDMDTRRYSTATGKNSVYSGGLSTKMDAFHGIVNGQRYDMAKTWKAN